MSYGDYPDLKDVRRVLVIKLRHHGDVLLTSPVFSFLKKNLPKAEIDALIYKDTLPMLDGHPAIHRFFLYDRALKKRSFFGRMAGEIKLLWEMRKRGYDLVVNLTEGDRGAIVALLTKSRIRVGCDPHKSGFLGKRKIYTHLAKTPRGPRHAVERGLDVLRRIGLFPSSEERELFFHLPQTALEKVRALLGENGLEAQDFFLVHPVSRWRFKCPPPSFTAELIRKLDLPVVISSGPDKAERAFVEEILKLVPDVKVVDVGGKISLKELGALIALARCLICVDSVPLHIASALKTPVVVLFGPTSELNWGPWQNPNARIVAQNFACRPCHLDGCGGSKRSDCLYSLSVDQVIEALNSLSQLYAGR